MQVFVIILLYFFIIYVIILLTKERYKWTDFANRLLREEEKLKIIF